MASSGLTAAQPTTDHDRDLMPGTPVEIRDGDTTPGLVTEWRVDGTRQHHQERVVVATKSAGEIKEIDAARDNVAVIEGQEADLIRGVIADHV
jgi:RecB family endonuclease NucS